MEGGKAKLKRGWEETVERRVCGWEWSMRWKSSGVRNGPRAEGPPSMSLKLRFRFSGGKSRLVDYAIKRNRFSSCWLPSARTGRGQASPSAALDPARTNPSLCRQRPTPPLTTRCEEATPPFRVDIRSQTAESLPKKNSDSDSKHPHNDANPPNTVAPPKTRIKTGRATDFARAVRRASATFPNRLLKQPRCKKLPRRRRFDPISLST